ncbi:MAG: hypothetical protein Q4F03_04955, partial [Eubacteriales bacterium]|nr:hypothetical protein [Eubacteriales bacterium]
MADITQFLDEIRKALYGEEVRSSIINALKKVNDDNNSYQALKSEVITARDNVQEFVRTFDSKVANANKVAETLVAEIGNANTVKTQLDTSTQNANTVK